MGAELATLQKSVAETDSKMNVLTKRLDGVLDKLSRTPDPNHPKASDVFGLPHGRIGENIMGSRGYSFTKMIGVISGQLSPDEAKVEMDVANRLNQVYGKDGGYSWRGIGMKCLAPLATDFMHDCHVPASFRHEMKCLVRAGSSGFDPDQATHLTKSLREGGYWQQKAMSWLSELTGGSLVAPPEQGELIELLRNKEALVNAGARTVPLPPQGRIQYPRQTSASTTYWVGESAPIPDSTPGTGTVTLQAKKLAVRIIAPNELIRFASPAAEALMRDDMTKSLALGLDLAGLEGSGGDNRPRGIINDPNINVMVSSDVRADGDAIVGRDIYRGVALIEENNATMEGWIMRPKTWFKYLGLRSDAVAQGDQAGMFLFNPVRDCQYDGGKPMLGGYPVTKSTQVSQVRSKGASSALTYIVWGMWSDLLIGMFGAIEFAATTQGDTAFTNDQTWVRGILSADIVARHSAAFGFMDVLSTTI